MKRCDLTRRLNRSLHRRLDRRCDRASARRLDGARPVNHLGQALGERTKGEGGPTVFGRPEDGYESETEAGLQKATERTKLERVGEVRLENISASPFQMEGLGSSLPLFPSVKCIRSSGRSRAALFVDGPPSPRPSPPGEGEIVRGLVAVSSDGTGWRIPGKRGSGRQQFPLLGERTEGEGGPTVFGRSEDGYKTEAGLQKATERMKLERVGEVRLENISARPFQMEGLGSSLPLFPSVKCIRSSG